MQLHHKIYHSLLRSHTLFGAERVVFLMWTLMCVLILMLNLSFISALLTLFMWALGYSLIAYLTKLDPRFREVYARAIKYKRVYLGDSLDKAVFRRKFYKL